MRNYESDHPLNACCDRFLVCSASRRTEWIGRLNDTGNWPQTTTVWHYPLAITCFEICIRDLRSYGAMRPEPRSRMASSSTCAELWRHEEGAGGDGPCHKPLTHRFNNAPFIIVHEATGRVMTRIPHSKNTELYSADRCVHSPNKDVTCRSQNSAATLSLRAPRPHGICPA